MRKIVFAALAAMSFSLSACGPKSAQVADPTDVPQTAATAEAVAVDEPGVQAAQGPVDAMDKSEQLVEWFRTKQWNQNRASDAVDAVGDFEHVVSRVPYGNEEEDVLRVEVIAKHAGGLLKYNVLWDAERHVGGFDVQRMETPAACPSDCLLDVAAVFDGYISRDYARFSRNATEDFREAVTEEKAYDVLDKISMIFGDFEYAEAPYLDDPAKHIYRMKVKHADHVLVYSYAFDDEGRLRGFLIRPVEEFMEVKELDPEFTGAWKEDKVTVQADDRYALSGLLTLPRKVDKPPVVILVHGSGCNDANETVGANEPFADIAHGLAERGIAAIRYHKRCKQFPDSAKSDPVTIQNEVTDDFDAAVRVAQADGRVDAKRIFVLGHSLGGMLVPYLASKHPELAGAVSMSGSLRNFFVMLKQQQALALESLRKTADDATVAEIEKMYRENEEKLARIDTLGDDEEIYGQPVRYWRSLLETEGGKWIAKVKKPILVLHGGADLQVYAEDYAEWQAAAKRHSNIRCLHFDRLNHLMMPTTLENPNIMDVEKDYAVKSSVDAAVLDAIADFVKKGK